MANPVGKHSLSFSPSLHFFETSSCKLLNYLYKVNEIAIRYDRSGSLIGESTAVPRTRSVRLLHHYVTLLRGTYRLATVQSLCIGMKRPAEGTQDYMRMNQGATRRCTSNWRLGFVGSKIGNDLEYKLTGHVYDLFRNETTFNLFFSIAIFIRKCQWNR